MNFILCGLPKSGKTTVGRLLAERLSWDFVDTDQLIEDTYQTRCSELYQAKGELEFRGLEKRAIANLVGLKRTVILTGGGSLMDCENRAVLIRLGTCVLLKVSGFIKERFDPVPPYLDRHNPEKSFLELVVKRKPFYEEVANRTILVENLTPEAIVQEILNG